MSIAGLLRREARCWAGFLSCPQRRVERPFAREGLHVRRGEAQSALHLRYYIAVRPYAFDQQRKDLINMALSREESLLGRGFMIVFAKTAGASSGEFSF